MSIVTLEGVVDHGRIRLKGDFRLPDRTKVYVIVPDADVDEMAQVVTRCE